VSYFDTKAKEYKSIQTPVARLTVTAGDKQVTESIPGLPTQGKIQPAAKQEVKAIGHDILPIRTSVRELDRGRETTLTGLFLWGIFLLPPLVYGLALCGKKIRKKAESDRTLIKSRKAAKIFARSCRRDSLFPTDVVQAVRTYLNDRLGLSLGTLTAKEAYDICISCGVSSKSSKQLKECLQLLENAIYSGQDRNIGDLREQITAIIKRIDKEMR
jgi:hypothetical protein